MKFFIFIILVPGLAGLGIHVFCGVSFIENPILFLLMMFPVSLLTNTIYWKLRKV